jgi:8-amino-7-oxononanoate synthase
VNLREELHDHLKKLEAGNRLRKIESLASAQGPYINIDNRRFTNLCSNDYLGLASDPRLIGAAKNALDRWGTGAGSSRLLSGSLDIHDQLEKAAADFVDMDTSLAFSSGYAANVGLLSALAGPKDVVFSDALNHASLIDGCRLSRAKIIVYRHLDTEDLNAKLAAERSKYDRAFLVTESYFSMDGDCAPLRRLVESAEQYDASILVDEAHALGVFGRGLCFEQEISRRCAAIVGTFGKSFGSGGAFVAGTDELRNYLLNSARSFIFSTGMPPVVAAAALEAIQLVRSEGIALRSSLLKKSSRFRRALSEAGVPLQADSRGPIIPVILGEDQTALTAAESLRKAGILARAIRPPSVPENTARLRFTVSIGHKNEDLENAARIVGGFFGA